MNPSSPLASGLGGTVGALLVLLIKQVYQSRKDRRRDSAVVEVAEIDAAAKFRADILSDVWLLRKAMKDAEEQHRKETESLREALRECQDKHFEVVQQQAILKADNAQISAENARITAEHVSLKRDHERLQAKVGELERVSVGLKIDDKGLTLEEKPGGL